MKERIKKLCTAAIAYGLIVGIIVAIVAMIAYFGGAVMKVFGFVLPIHGHCRLSSGNHRKSISKSTVVLGKNNS